MSEKQQALFINEIILQAEKAGGEMMLCTESAHHISLIYEMLSELPKAAYPRTWEAVSRSTAARKLAAEKMQNGIFDEQADSLLKKGHEDGWEDGFFLPFARREAGKIHVNFVSSIAQNVYEMITAACVVDPAAGEAGAIIDRSTTHVCYPPRHTLSAHAWLKVNLPEDTADAGRELVVLQFAGWVTRDGWFKAGINVRRLPEEEKRAGNLLQECGAGSADDLSMSLLDIHVTGPVHTKTTPGTPIVISYGRDYLVEEEIDYPLGGISTDNFYIPCTGNADFKDSRMQYQGVAEPGASASQLILVRDGGGVLTYQGGFASHVQKTATGFSWDFSDARWKNGAGFIWSASFKVGMFLTLQYITNLRPQGEILTVNPTEDIGGDKEKIDKLAIYWGCLGKDVKVRMADGSLRCISKIKIGEKVASTKDALEVKDVITGEETQGMMRLYTQKGKGVLATSQHPILTADGIKMVQELRPGEDLIVMEDGSRELLTEILVEEIRVYPIYNLVLCKAGGGDIPADAGFLFADGMTVGDNNMQGLAVSNYHYKRQQKYGLPADWKQDVESAVHQFSYLQGVDILWKQE